MELEEIKTLIKDTPDFPKPGILFRDIFPIFLNPIASHSLVQHIVAHVKSLDIHVVVGLDSRGFLLGPWLSHALNCAFVPVRKAGKLPPPCYKAAYEKEYGTDYFEIQQNAIPKDANVLIIDDLIATGGSARAAGQLVSQAGGKVQKYVFLVELMFLNGKSVLDAPTYSLFQFD